MKEDKYTKRLAKNQVYAIVHMRDIRKNLLPKFIKLCMETPCLCPFQGHKNGRPKTTEWGRSAWRTPKNVYVGGYLAAGNGAQRLWKDQNLFAVAPVKSHTHYSQSCNYFFPYCRMTALHSIHVNKPKETTLWDCKGRKQSSSHVLTLNWRLLSSSP